MEERKVMSFMKNCLGVIKKVCAAFLLLAGAVGVTDNEMSDSRLLFAGIFVVSLLMIVMPFKGLPFLYLSVLFAQFAVYSWAEKDYGFVVLFFIIALLIAFYVYYVNRKSAAKERIDRHWFWFRRCRFIRQCDVPQ